MLLVGHSIAEDCHAKVFLSANQEYENTLVPHGGFSGIAKGDVSDSLVVSNGQYKEIRRFTFTNDGNSLSIGPQIVKAFRGSFLDDVVSYPDGDGIAVSGTGFLTGEVPTKLANGTQIESNPGPFVPCTACGVGGGSTASNLEGINPITILGNDLVMASAFNPTRIAFLDYRGISNPVFRSLIPPTGLNGFGFCPDGLLYAPHGPSGRVVAINVTTGFVSTVLTGLANPISSKCDPSGKLYVLSRGTGDVHVATKVAGVYQRTVLTNLEPALDNFYYDNGFLYITNDQNTIFKVDAVTGTTDVLLRGEIKSPSDMAYEEEFDNIYIADATSIKLVEASDGTIIDKLIVDTPEAGFGGQITGLSLDSQYLTLVDSAQGGLIVLHKNLTLRIYFPGVLNGLQANSAVRIVDETLPFGEYFVVTDAINGRLRKFFQLSSGVLTNTTLVSGLVAPVKLVYHEGYVYMTEAGQIVQGIPNTGVLSKVDPTTGVKSVLLTGLNNPQGFAISSKNNRIVLAEVGNQRVLLIKISHPSNYQVMYSGLRIDLNPTSNSRVPIPFGTITAVASNKNANKVYVTENLVNTILKLKNCN